MPCIKIRCNTYLCEFASVCETSAPGIKFRTTVYMKTIVLVIAFTNLVAPLSPVEVQYLTPWLDLQESFEQFGF